MLTKAIRDSKIFLFISSVNSNQSKWTSNEISTALEFKKTIIPFRLDESPYNDSVMMKIVSYDYIECQNKKKAISKLLIAIKHHLSSETNAFDDSSNKSVIEEVNEVHPKLTKKRIIQWTILIVLSIVAIVMFIVLYNKGEYSIDPQIVTIQEESNSNVCQPVDLGLTSGTIWADRNVGAANISDFGDLYAWGEISKKKDYSQGLYNSTNKPKTSITSAKFDVATSIWGEEWTIPTEKQFKELLDECQWQWTRIKGHYSYLITGKNRNQFFCLPLAGSVAKIQTIKIPTAIIGLQTGSYQILSLHAVYNFLKKVKQFWVMDTYIMEEVLGLYIQVLQ